MCGGSGRRRRSSSLKNGISTFCVDFYVSVLLREHLAVAVVRPGGRRRQHISI